MTAPSDSVNLACGVPTELLLWSLLGVLVAAASYFAFSLAMMMAED